MIKYDFKDIFPQPRVSVVASFIIFIAATQNVDEMKTAVDFSGSIFCGLCHTSPLIVKSSVEVEWKLLEISSRLSLNEPAKSLTFKRHKRLSWQLLRLLLLHMR
jgi:hypothetical protein